MLDNDPRIQILDKINPVYRTYLNSLLDNYAGPEEIGTYVELLLNPKKTLTRIVTAVTQLNRYGVTEHTANNQLVKEAYSQLNLFISSKVKILARTGAVFSVFGSIRFDDPQNLDVDSVFITDKHFDYLAGVCEYDWNEELQQLWNNQFGIQTHGPAYVSVERLKYINDRVNNRDHNFFQQEGVFIEGDLDSFSGILTGVPLFAAKPKSVSKYQFEIVNLCKHNPLIGASVCKVLGETLYTRLSRRGLI
ncbi:MAG: hypothetical protein AAB874_03555 [Patescibacteria group bacterium]